MIDPSDIESYAGRSRAVIDKVIPCIDGGLFPVKRVQGEPFHIEAHIFADGHDTVCATLEYRRRAAAEWAEVPFKDLPNDEWEVTITPEGIGFFEYRVVAWVDHFRFWFEGFAKKRKEGQVMDVELHIGANLILMTAQRAKGADAARLRELAAKMTSGNCSSEERYAIAQSAELFSLATQYPDRTNATRSATMTLLVERELALFGSWYEFFPRSWGTTPGKHATLAEAARILPEVRDMGFNIVYLPPVSPIGKTFRKGRNNALEAAPDDPGSPWAIGSLEGGHKAVNPQLGTLDDFRAFVARSNELGMEVALDIAFQCSRTTLRARASAVVSTGAPTARYSTPKIRPRSIKTSSPSTSRPRTGRTSGGTAERIRILACTGGEDLPCGQPPHQEHGLLALVPGLSPSRSTRS
jgi:starch synthase (maltosyl-transferring)